MAEITRLTAEQCKMVEDNINLAYGAIQKYNIKRRFGHILEDDDIEQIANLALCIAATKYGGSQGAFSTYVYTSIRNAVYQEVKKHLSKKRNDYKSISLESLVDDSDFLEWQECEGFTEAQSVEVTEALDDAKERHSNRTTDGIDAMKLQDAGYKLEEIGEMYGVTEKRVSMWISRAKQRLATDKLFINAVF